jgi:hypothetical protein
MCTSSCKGDHPSSVKIWAEVKSMFQLEPTDQSSRDKKKRKQYWSDFDVVSGAGEGADSKAGVKEDGSGSQKQAKLDLAFAVPAVLSEGMALQRNSTMCCLSSTHHTLCVWMLCVCYVLIGDEITNLLVAYCVDCVAVTIAY